MKQILKRASYLSVTAGFVLSVMGSTGVARAFGGGDGSAEAPYQIASCDDLEDIALNDDSVHYVLTQDIDCSGVNEGGGFAPIGGSGLANPFKGVLDGHNYTVSGVTIDAGQQDGAGLFAGTEGATIKNLKLDGVTITDAGSDTGSLVGMAYNTTISHVSSTNLSITLGSDGWNVGGLTGQFDSGDSGATVTTMDSSRAAGTITSSVIGGLNYGGLVGELNYNVITNSYADVAVDALHAERLGGLVGGSFHAQIKNTYALGDLIGDLTAGGLIGLDGGSSKIYNSFAIGWAGASRGDWGGLVAELGGSPTATITNSYFDKTSTSTIDCTWNGPEAGCTAVNADGTDGDHFKNTSSVAPLTSWDFQSAWQTTAGYPVLRDLDLDTPPALSVPGAVGGLTVTPQDGALLVSWTMPADDGNAPITDFQVRYRVHGSGSWTNTNVGASTIFTTITATNNVAYDVAVAATNSVGNGSYSEVDDIAAGLAPGPVQNLGAAPNYDDASITIHWQEPAAGTPSGYQAYIRDQDGANTWSAPDTLDDATLTDAFTGLTQGHTYDFKVVATSLLGDGDPAELDGVALVPQVYDITSCEQLQAIRNDLTGDYRLMNDIDCSGTVSWNGGAGFTPIGDTTSPFMGTLDGRGHTISDLYIAGGDYAGLFGILLGGARVSNLHLTGVQIFGTASVGAIAGGASQDVVIDYVTVDGVVVGEIPSGVGGFPIMGIGGLVGLGGLDMTISHSSMSGTVGGIADNGVSVGIGGLAGVMLDAMYITDSYSTAQVVAPYTGLFAAGGLVGAQIAYLGLGTNPVISNSYAAGSVEVADDAYAGGLAGVIGDGEIYNSFTASVLFADGDPSGLGAVVGQISGDVVLSGVYADAAAAGIATCDADGTLTDCILVNTEGDQADYFFGADGSLNPPLDTWDFDTIWQTQDGDYPVLRPAPVAPDSGDGDSGDGDSDGGPGDTGGTDDGASSGAADGNTIANQSGTRHFVRQLVSGALAAGIDGPQDGTYNLDDLSGYLGADGALLHLSVGQVVHFTLKRNGRTEQHTVTVKEVGNGYVVLTIASTPFDVRLQTGQTRQVSISGTPAISIGLEGLVDGQAVIRFSRVAQPDGTATGVAAAANPSAEDGRNLLVTGVVAIAALLVAAGLVLAVRRATAWRRG